MKKVVLLICFVLLAFQTYAQQKTSSVYFDEYAEKDEINQKLLDEKIERFAKELLKLPLTVKAQIIYTISLSEYECWSDKKSTAEIRSQYVKEKLINNYGIPNNRIIMEYSQRNYSETLVRFVLISENAQDLTDMKGMSSDDLMSNKGVFLDCVCPSFEIQGSKTVTDKKEPLIFVVNLSGWMDTPKIEWKVSVGKIINGQGTQVITVDISEVQGAEIKVFVELKVSIGFDKYCLNEGIFTTKILSK